MREIYSFKMILIEREGMFCRSDEISRYQIEFVGVQNSKALRDVIDGSTCVCKKY